MYEIVLPRSDVLCNSAFIWQNSQFTILFSQVAQGANSHTGDVWLRHNTRVQISLYWWRVFNGWHSYSFLTNVIKMLSCDPYIYFVHIWFTLSTAIGWIWDRTVSDCLPYLHFTRLNGVYEMCFLITSNSDWNFHLHHVNLGRRYLVKTGFSA